MSEVSLHNVIVELDNLFKIFNDRFFSGELEKPVITVSPDTTRGAYGWCTLWKAWKVDGVEDGGYYEINLCAEYLNRTFADTCSTLIHEMVHLYNLAHKIQDCSRNGLYHNKRFKSSAEEHGLIVDKDSKYGYCRTRLNDDALAFVVSLGKSGFCMNRPKFKKTGNTKPSSSRKYVCPGCGAIVRATKEVNIRCDDCDLLMLEE